MSLDRNGAQQIGRALPWLILGAWSFWPSLQAMVRTWDVNPNYSHGFLVGPLALAILWRRRATCPPGSTHPGWGGLAVLGASVGVRWLATRFYFPDLDAWSFLLWIGGVVWILHGRQRLIWALPALIFLGFAVPLPLRVEQFLSLPLQKLAAAISGGVLQIGGYAATALGTTLWLDDQILEIEQACSGLRMFLGTIAMTWAYFWLSDNKRWICCVIIACAPAVAVIANVTRIVTTALAYRWLDNTEDIWDHLVHDIAGLAMVGVALLVYIGLYHALTWWDRLAGNVERRRALVLVSFVGGILLGGVALIHRGQSQRIQRELVQRALSNAAEGNWSGAVDCWRMVLQLHGPDATIETNRALAASRAAEDASEVRSALALLAGVAEAPSGDWRVAYERARLGHWLGDAAVVLAATESLPDLSVTDHRPKEAAAAMALWRANARWRLWSGSADARDRVLFWHDGAVALELAQGPIAPVLRLGWLGWARSCIAPEAMLPHTSEEGRRFQRALAIATVRTVVAPKGIGQILADTARGLDRVIEQTDWSDRWWDARLSRSGTRAGAWALRLLSRLPLHAPLAALMEARQWPEIDEPLPWSITP